MNYVKLHLGDFAKKTSDLTQEQTGAYWLLLQWYYGHLQPLPLDGRELRNIGKAHTPLQRRALELVLVRFFKQADDGWHNTRCDEEIKRYFGDGRRVAIERPATSSATPSATRQQRHRNARVALLDALAASGVVVRQDMSTDELRRLSTEHKVVVTLPSRDASRDASGDRQMTTQSKNPVIQEPPSGAPLARARQAGEACKAMKQAGVVDVNPAHPTLLALLEAGATNDELRLTAAELVARGKGKFVYVLAVVDGRRRDAAQAPEASARPLNARQLHERAVVEALAPALLPGAQRPAFLDPPTPTD